MKNAIKREPCKLICRWPSVSILCNKRTIITTLLALVVLTGHAQVKCHIEGELRDTTQGKSVVFCPVGVDIRVSDNYFTVKVT